MSHKPRKRFGQNFLHDNYIIEQIVGALHLQTDDNVIEIGPGQGALTQLLVKKLHKLTAIEIDRDLHAHLQNLNSDKNCLHLINEDALTMDFSSFGTNLRIIGNLPYNISTPLMLHLLKFTANISDMHFMLQKEVVLRLAGQPGSKDYGRLGILMQYYCEVEYLFDVPAEAFFPQPKVESAVVRLTPYKQSPWPDVYVPDLQALLAVAFSMRRKTLANNLKTVASREQLNQLGIDPGLRPEQISIMDYIRLTNAL